MYKTDIKKYGFEVIEFDEPNEKPIKEICKVLRDKEKLEKITGENFEIGKENLSFEVLRDKLETFVS